MALTVAPDFADGILTPSKLQQLSDSINERTPLFARKTADETVNNSVTLQDDNELFVTPEINKVYEFFLNLRFQSGTTPDFKFGFTIPSGATMPASTMLAPPTAAAVIVAATTGVTGIAGTAGNAPIVFFGVLIMGANAGTMQLQWAQNTLDASDTIVRAGSYLKLTRLA